ncbi:very short patch repair endonuclease [Brevibacterium yomogidense]|uniref:very short patch repair endonuclease n=1 Tax=Brevibacterium yomogidense TaxID=946573 RepID=UPI002FCCCBC3
MQANRRRDTAPELKIRRILHARGLRYRVDFAPGEDRRRKADIVFTRARIVVFVDGCFWHGCPKHFIAPKSNPEYWGPKIGANRRRDAETTERLQVAGWTVLRFWEHEDPDEASKAIIAAWSQQRH